MERHSRILFFSVCPHQIYKMTQSSRKQKCFIIMLTVFSTNSAKNLPESQTELASEAEPSFHGDYSFIRNNSVEISKRKSNVQLFTRSMKYDNLQLRKQSVPLLSSNFETRTEVLPLKDRNIVRYYLSEKSVPSSQSSTASGYVEEAKTSIFDDDLLRGFISQSVTTNSGHHHPNEANVPFPLNPSPTRLQDYKNPSSFYSPLKQFSEEGHQHERTANLYGLSYLFAYEAKDLLNEPLVATNDNGPQDPWKLPQIHHGYQSESTYLYSFPRFSIPLKSLQLDFKQNKDYNTETSDIIEPTFIVPEDKYVPKELLPQPSSPTMTYGVSISNGTFSRKEIRKDNGEFFSSYRDSEVTSAGVGSLVPTSDGDQVLVQRGSYSFTSPEGLRFRMDYTADETGYHATQIYV